MAKITKLIEATRMGAWAVAEVGRKPSAEEVRALVARWREEQARAEQAATPVFVSASGGTVN